MFEKSKWIWREGTPQQDEYSEFYFEFNAEGKTYINISADSDYALYINNVLAAFGQYADFPNYKIYDCVDITEYCNNGKNKCAIVVYYKGITTCSTYFPSDAGLLFEIISNDKIVSYSDTHIVSRLSKAYLNHKCKLISFQLGYTFHYSLDKEDNWKNGELSQFNNSVIVDKKVKLFPRPNKKTKLYNRTPYKIVKEENGRRYIFDFNEEQVGFIDIDLISSENQTLLISYGEHLADGNVRRTIGGRDFSVSFDLKQGANKYMNPFLRLGCRYIELFFEKPVEIKYAGIRPVIYPLNVLCTNLTGRRKEIYDASVKTLICCMHEHYEDCPWREQALYTMDSRNQMLCGYYAFKEFEFPRSCLKLISESIKPDGYLPICHPCGIDVTIPSFNMHYFTQVKEYYEYSHDITLIKEVYPVLEIIISKFISNLKDNLLPAITGKNMWNFYEWADNMDGSIGDLSTERNDLILNCLLVLSLKIMSEFSLLMKKDDVYSQYVPKILNRINETFYVKEKGLYKNYNNDSSFSQLGNSFAILCKAADEENTKRIAEKLVSDAKLTKASLSMEGYVYDALLLADREKYKSYVLSQLDEEYGYMLDQGATTFWETLEGERAFENAGSLCHGWSALPVYYYNILL